MREIKTKYNNGKCACGRAVGAGVRVMYDNSVKPSIRQCPACNAGLADGSAEGPIEPVVIRIRVQTVKKNQESWSLARVSIEPESRRPEFPIHGDSLFDACGNLGLIEVGDVLEVHGHFEIHDRYGTQFRVLAAARVVGSTLQGLQAFLEQLPNLGEARAQAVIQAFRQDRRAILDAIENHPELLTKVDGITMERAKAIQTAYLTEERDLRETNEWVAGLQLGPATTAQVLRTWKTKARAYLEEDPYRLMEQPGWGFVKADDVAINKFRIHPHDPRRAAAAVLFLLEEEEGEGHTWTPLSDLIGVKAAPGL